MTADVIQMSARHSWDKQPRMDDPSRHVYTCRRDGCGLKRRSEFDGRERVQLWLWPDGTGDRGKNYPPCRGGTVTQVAAVPVVAPTVAKLGAAPTAGSPQPPVHPCCRCVPPLPACGQPTRLYLGGWLCDRQAGITSGGAA